MTENIEAAELRAQVTELERMVVAQTVTITELRAAAVAAQAPITNAIGDDDRLVLIGALGLLRGHRYKGCADALQRVLDADAAAPTPPADGRAQQETAMNFDQYLAKKRYGSFTTRVLLKPCWDAAYQAGMDARPDPAMAGDSISDEEIIDLAVEPLQIDCDRMPYGVVVFARALLSRIQPAGRNLSHE